ncbi:myotubularin-related protein 14 [Anthonomus grandis grandis]|uniref:myotubularin-related protein 14 n=1 Tax=Anthonomus grandis grandis TaxID=2921223 RepID=UPI002165BBFA|nr:myotubularin-related protein 14 [Anthonomus grandis grandis]
MDEAQVSSAAEYGEQEICDLLSHFSQNTYSVSKNSTEPRAYINDALKLFERDYSIFRVKNDEGNLCPQYPSILAIPESPRQVTTIYENEDENNSKLDLSEIVPLLDGSKLARCRQRFPVPVILVNGKYICRSSTLASEPEICYRTGLINVPGYELLQSVKELWWPTEGLTPVAETNEEASNEPGPLNNDIRAQTICDKVRDLDIKLLKMFNVNTIVDIMVEKRKVKHSLYVSASEKVDAHRYGSFKLICLPYPGCEFFKDYHDAMFNPQGLIFDWENPANDAVLSVPNDNILKNLSIPFHQYKEWDLVIITQNYIKYVLKRVQEENTGILVHCISGWDRTPLFISLLRLSLWADYLVHPTLNEYEILFFTLAYDWYLFGHHLSNRIYKKEEIMAFCFDFLRYLGSEEFSIKTSKKKYSEEGKTDDSRSPSRSSTSSSAGIEDNMQKKKRTQAIDNLLLEASENSNDSFTVAMDICSEDSNSSVDPENMSTGTGLQAHMALPSDETLMECMNCDELPIAKVVLSAPTVGNRKTSPIPVGGASRRQRSESTGSNSSTISATWQVISECGSVENDLKYKPQRQQRLERVRSIFNSCYQKAVKSESFGPPKKWMIEEIVGSLSHFSGWFDNINDANGSSGDNGNQVNGSSVNGGNINTPTGLNVEMNGNGTAHNEGPVGQNGIPYLEITKNGDAKIVEKRLGD